LVALSSSCFHTPPEPKKKRVPKAATLPTQTAEELELERIFERRGAEK